MKAIVKIPNISWRDGRPRFNPGPKLRVLGFKGEDLRHADGSWMSLREVEDWAKGKSGEIAARRAKKASGTRLRPIARHSGPKGYTIEDLFEDLYRSKHFANKAAKTQADYRKKAEAFAKFEPALWGVPARDMTPAAVHGLHEKLWTAKGLPMANGMIAVLRLAYSLAIKRAAGGVVTNPCLRMGLPTPEPRLRCASPQEIAALMQAADALEPSIADAIVLALFTGQRQGDVLALTEAGVARAGADVSSAGNNVRIRLRQRKTGAVVSVFALAPLVARLAAIRERNREQGRVGATIVLHPTTGRQWNEHSFRHRFAEIRAAGCEQCPSLADFLFMDLRDTAVTWLHRAGCTESEIASVTGHSEKTVSTILRHYLVKDESTNDRAMTKFGAWLDKEGVRV